MIRKLKVVAGGAVTVAFSTMCAVTMAMGWTPPAHAANPTGSDAIQVAPYRPVPTIIEPELSDSYSITGGTASVPFLGTAVDPQDGGVPGTRLRWTATAGSRTIVMCQGSSWPGSASTGSPGVYKECTWGVASLPALLPGQSWAVQLCAADKHSNIGCTLRQVPVRLVVP